MTTERLAGRWDAELEALAMYASAGAVRALELREQIHQRDQFVPSSEPEAAALSAARRFAKAAADLRAACKLL